LTAVAPGEGEGEHRRGSQRAGAPAGGQRTAFEAALLDLCFERGYRDLTIDDLLERTGLGREVFERDFAGLEDCLESLFAAEQGRFFASLDCAAAPYEAWRDRVRATAYGLLRYLRDEPEVARLFIYEARYAGERVKVLWSQGFERLFDLIDEGRSEPGAPDSLTRATAESVGGGLFNQIYVALSRGPLAPEEDIVPQLMYTVVLPYLGVAGAAEELEIRPPPDPARRDDPGGRG
jgi:AcrR family transcriptional regulator